MAQSPKILIITPSFNQGRFLEDTILSVLNQNYSNLEYIIIDGGSTDYSVEIIRKHQKHLAYWVSEKDKGQSHAINKGLAKGKGEIIGWLNSDDTYLPGTLETVAKAFERFPEYDVVYGDQVLTDEDGVFLRTKHELPYSYHRLIYHMYQSQPATFFKRSVYEKLGGINEDLHYCMDHEFFLRIGKDCKVLHLPIALATYRLHAAAKSAAHGESRHRNEQHALTKKYLPKYTGSPTLNKVLQIFWRVFYLLVVRFTLVLRDNPFSYLRYRTFKIKAGMHTRV